MRPGVIGAVGFAAAFGLGDSPGVTAVVVGRPGSKGEADFLEIAHALGALGLGLRPR